MIVPLYIPTASNRHAILPGAALVGEWDFMVGRVMLDFEGNKYGAVNLQRYIERCMVAWHRHATRYPTVSRIWVLSGEVSEIGFLDTERKRAAVGPNDLPRLAQWLDMETVPERELVY